MLRQDTTTGADDHLAGTIQLGIVEYLLRLLIILLSYVLFNLSYHTHERQCWPQVYQTSMECVGDR